MEKLTIPVRVRAGAQGVAPQPWRVTQGDRGAYLLVIKAEDGWGRGENAFNYARILFTRPDGVVVAAEPERTDEGLSYLMEAAEVDAPGGVVACVQWFDEGARVTSARFSFRVEPDPSRAGLSAGDEEGLIERLLRSFELDVSQLRADIARVAEDVGLARNELAETQAVVESLLLSSGGDAPAGGGLGGELAGIKAEIQGLAEGLSSANEGLEALRGDLNSRPVFDPAELDGFVRQGGEARLERLEADIVIGAVWQ